MNFHTCKSTDWGTLVSSILAASDKQATANNCTAQLLSLYMPKKIDKQISRIEIINKETR